MSKHIFHMLPLESGGADKTQFLQIKYWKHNFRKFIQKFINEAVLACFVLFLHSKKTNDLIFIAGIMSRRAAKM